MGLKEKFTENAEQFDLLMAEMLAENEKLKNTGAGLAGCLWDYHKVCPECGNRKGDHMESCKQIYEIEYKSPADFQVVFDKAFDIKA